MIGSLKTFHLLEKEVLEENKYFEIFFPVTYQNDLA